MKEIFNEIGNISNNPPTEKEMQIIKKIMLKSFSKVLENSFSTNDAIGTSILENNKELLIDFEKTVNDMTSKDIINTAKKYLDLDRASITVVHPQNATKESIENNHKTVTFTGKDAISMTSVKEYNTQNNYRLIIIDSKTDNVEILLKIANDEKYDTNN